jgi:hypothetical protein
MGIKLFLNTFYTIVIVIALIAGYQYGIVQSQPTYIAIAVVLIAIFIWLKIKLLKQIRGAQKP